VWRHSGDDRVPRSPCPFRRRDERPRSFRRQCSRASRRARSACLDSRALSKCEPVRTLSAQNWIAILGFLMKQTFTCPVELALEVLGGKWRVVILAHVKEGASRYAELRRRIPRMSDKMLTQRLRELVESGLLLHRGGAYRLTVRGARAREALTALHSFGEILASELDVRLETATVRGALS
jgi:DNA-binding HxlR family transcriptional regulator